MSITQGISRSAIGKLFRARRNFKLRLVSTGFVVKTDYHASVHTLQYGDFIAIMGPNSEWVDIGQITNDYISRDTSGYKRYEVTLIPRLVESSSPQSITVVSKTIVCRLRVHDV